MITRVQDEQLSARFNYIFRLLLLFRDGTKSEYTSSSLHIPITWIFLILTYISSEGQSIYFGVKWIQNSLFSEKISVSNIFYSVSLIYWWKLLGTYFVTQQMGWMVGCWFPVEIYRRECSKKERAYGDIFQGEEYKAWTSITR